MIFVKFEDLLKRTMGLDAGSVGTSVVERAVQARVQACKARDAEDYWGYVSSSRTELQELIEAVVVPETWFFRDAQAFAAMARAAIEGIPHAADGVLRVLSLPCSTGEEPYTMAMALIDAGLSPGRFRIDAIDISGRALERAQAGVYGRNSFRGKDLAYRDRHFEPVEQGYRIGEAVRGSIRFARGNLFDPAFSPAADFYDIIFCRNMLIYFDSETQDRAIGTLKRLLAPKGMLFVGHAETGLPLAHDLVSAKIPMAFAFRKAEPRLRPARPEAPPARPLPRPFPSRSMPATPWSARPKEAKPPVPRTVSLAPRQGIEELRQLADRGFLAEAAKGCEAYLRGSGPSPDALHLLGLISDAGGNPAAAAQYYRKTLYLEPEHHEALSHLALLLERQGDVAGARILHDRIRRLSKRTGG